MIKNENTPTLQTKRLILRKFNEGDVQSLFLLMRDREVNTFLPWFPITTLEEAQSCLQKNYLTHYQLTRSYQYAICLKEDNQPIGYVTLHEDDSHDLGYGLRKEFWHQGIVTEACLAIIDRLKDAGYSYITATHDTKNPHSGNVMKKLGMKYRYSYEEQVQPKNIRVTFHMYQINFDEQDEQVYEKYQANAIDQKIFIEKDI